MNLSKIETLPFVQGTIHIAADSDRVTGEITTHDYLEICDRVHDGVPEIGQIAKMKMHPIHQKISQGKEKIQEIPITLFYNRADNAIRIGYRAYDKETGKPVCAGDGKTAKRAILAADGTDTKKEVACQGSESCEYAKAMNVSCYRQVRMAVQLDAQEDSLSVFEVRSTSINTYRALKAQLLLIEKRLKGLRHVPLLLKVWQTSNTLSNYEAFHCMRLEYAGKGEVDAYRKAKMTRDELAELGIMDDNDAAFESQDEIESYFNGGGDAYAVALNLGSSAPRRSGSSSMTAKIIEKVRAKAMKTEDQKNTETIGQGNIAESADQSIEKMHVETTIPDSGWAINESIASAEKQPIEIKKQSFDWESIKTVNSMDFIANALKAGF